MHLILLLNKAIIFICMKYEEFYDFVVKVHSIAKIGLTFSKDPYALENYKELQNISKEMIEKFMDVKFDRPSMFTRDIYPTPNMSVRTMIVNDKDEVLLVKESNSNTWSLPGGWCDLFDSPKEAAFNEVSQEAGVDPEITRLIAVLNRTPYKNQKNVPEYVIVFEGNIDHKKFHEHTHETNDVKFFPLKDLPELSRKMTKEEILRLIDAYYNKETIFD